MMNNRLATPAACAVAVVTFGAILLITHVLWASLVVAALLSGASYILLERRTGEDFDSEAYLSKAREGIAEVRKEIKTIEGQTAQVRDEATRSALTKACSDLNALLAALKDDRTSNELLSETANLRLSVGSVRESLGFYIQMEADPDGYLGGHDSVLAGQERYKRFAAASHDSLLAVRRNDVALYRSKLATVAPDGVQAPRITPRREIQ